MTESVEILGAWQDMFQFVPSNRMVLDAEQLAQHWRRVSLTADFWSSYLALHAPTVTTDERLNREAVHGVLSYLLNELIENCAKFSAGPVKTICFESWALDDRMVFQITNHIKPDRRGPFIGFLQTLLAGDPAELYFKRIEEYTDNRQSGSGLGYLTLMMDYDIRFGFRFRPVNEESVAIDVQAHVSMLK
jgi:hypothetical protein